MGFIGNIFHSLKVGMALLLCLFVAVLLAAPRQVLAVDNLGLFELDANSADSASAGDDFDTIQAGTSSTATLQLFATDDINVSTNDSTTFTGGGSKDTEVISNWKQTSGNVSTKNDVYHGFAANYTYTGSSVTGSDGTVHLAGDTIFYIGLDTVPSTGSVAVSFWLLQDSSVAPGAGTSWNGAHQDGDVLVQANIAGGGSVTIDVDIWDAGTGGLANIISAAPTCSGGNQVICGIANTSAINVGWTYDPDENNTQDQVPTGKFFEYGLNVSALFRRPDVNRTPSCFSTILHESRSSTSKSAQLKDFIRSGIEVCAFQVSVAATDAAASEPTDDGEFTFTLSGGTLTSDLTVNYSISGTAANGVDYSNLTGSAIIPAGSTSVVLPVSVIDDAVVENSETVVVTITSTSSTSVNIDTAADSDSVTIADDDTASLSIDNISVNEAAGTAAFTVTLSGAVQDGFTIDYTTTDGTATAGADYTTTSGGVATSDALTFTGTDTETQTITVPILTDALVEGDETYTVDLSNISNTLVTFDAQGLGTITDPAVDLTIIKDDGAATTTYTPGGTTTYTITVNNAGPDDAIAAVVADTLPNGVTVNGSWTCTPSGGASCISGSATASDTGIGNINQTVDIPNGDSLVFSVPVTFSSDPAAY